MQTIENETLIYVAGFVAHMFRHKYPNLGVPTASFPFRDDWLSCISRGNYIYPSKDLQVATIIMNEEFIKFHGDTFNSNCFIFDNLSTIVCKKVSFPKMVIACFVRTYIHLR
ncbi:hypothetical protein ALC60_12871 [Trachymyrmex zeteki]|uniref:Uncharacterized protein n=1 Tax=Mycetomoellerius zeteki TaxID=64791 RepID=A0A151WJQ7_9HYME|nr:hypothetical protein ALC60_12871 [Trachymyrmex zeteki]